MKELQIKDICDKGSSNLKQKDVEGKKGRYPVYGASGIISHIDTYHQEENYIAIVKDGSGIGRVSFMPAKSSVIGTMQYILPKKGFNINYIGYCLQSLDLSTYKQGAAIPHIYFRDYGERIVKVSDDVNEQQRIVDYLDSAFAKIDAMKANAEKALNEAKALFQASLKEMLEPKEGWEEKELQDICQIKGGKRLPRGYVLSSEPMPHRYITVADFTKNGTVIPSTVKYISDEVYKTIKRYTITSDDVYVTIVGSTVGKAGIIPPELDGANLTENACKLVLNSDYDKRFVYYLMCSEYVIKQEQLLTKVSAQPKLALNRLASIVVYIPSLSEQQSIVTALDSLKSKVDHLQENYTKISQECDALKQAILRQIFE